MTFWMLVRFVLGLGIFAAVFRSPRTRIQDAALLAGVLLLAVLQMPTLWRPPFFADCDLYYFWSAGRAVRDGKDPYAIQFLNPPNSLLLYAIISFVPFKILAWAWKGFAVGGTCALVPLSHCLVVPPNAAPSPLSRLQIFGLSALVFLSDASVRNTQAGQVHVLVAATIVLALVAHERGKPVLAGILFSVAAIKIHTLAAFLLLFNPRTERRLWISFLGALAVQTLIAAPPGVIVDRCASMLRNVRDLAAPGGGNDYSFEGPACAGILGFNHALFRLGFRNRSVIGALHALLTAVLLLWALWRAHRGGLSRSARCSLMALVSMGLLYHRLYDTLLLALPLLYSAVRAGLDVSPSARRLRGVVGTAITLLWYLPEWALATWTKPEAPWVLQALVLAGPFWLLLGAIAAFDLAERHERRAQAPSLAPLAP